MDLHQVHLDNCALISADFATLRAERCLLDDAVPRTTSLFSFTGMTISKGNYPIQPYFLVGEIL